MAFPREFLNRLAPAKGTQPAGLPLALWPVLAGFALAPLSSKSGGAAWLLLCLFGLWAALRKPVLADAPDTGAARIWLAACLAGLTLEVLATAWWHGPWDELHAPARLFLAAAATLALRRRFEPAAPMRDGFAHALALGCLAAFGMALFQGDNRDSYPTNVIPWAVGTAFMVCLLLPRSVDAGQSPGRRVFWNTGVLAGLLAVVLSQSRGAYGVIAWVLMFHMWTLWRRRRVTRAGLAIACAAAALLVLAVALLPRVFDTSLQRLRLAVVEAEQASETTQPGGANTSVGARIYLWRMAVRGFAESPLIGLGGAERKRRIRAEGERMNSPVISALGHVHNQYLNSAMDHGVLGLAAVLAWMAGLGVAAARAGRRDALAGWQLCGLLFMHATASLTNANFIHTYYGIMLALCASLVLLTARHAGSPAVAATPG
jgi:O-antigen ligase